MFGFPISVCSDRRRLAPPGDLRFLPKADEISALTSTRVVFLGL